MKNELIKLTLFCVVLPGASINGLTQARVGDEGGRPPQTHAGC